MKEEKKNRIRIVFEADPRIEDEAYIEELAEKLSRAVEDMDVWLGSLENKYILIEDIVIVY